MSKPKKEKKIVLWRRIFDFLQLFEAKHPGKAVTRRELFKISLAKGYTEKEVWDALEKIDDKLQIAKFSTKGEGVQYQFLNIPHWQLRKMEEDRKWFDSLPG